MIKKRSKFWTIVFAMVPGAGHMFNGFMKRGVSIMGLFAAIWFVASWLNLGALGLLTPVVWFFSFFDCINLRFQDDEDFYMQEDGYLFDLGALRMLNLGDSRIRGAVGIGLIIVGVYALWNNVVMHFVWNYGLLPHVVVRAISEISYVIPQLIVGVLIILVGLALVKGKKREMFYGPEDEMKKSDPFEADAAERNAGEAGHGYGDVSRLESRSEDRSEEL